jgi:group I intron endonuclease
MRKHGIDSIQIDVIEICNDKSLLSSREVFWIKYYRDLNFDLLNVLDGGGGILSVSGRDKILSALVGNNHALGYRHTEEAIARIGKASTGNQHALGYNHTEEARKKISEAHAGKSRPHSKRTAHTRWHTNKNVSKPETCKYCKEEIE